MLKLLGAATAIVGCGLFMLIGQQPRETAVYTASQAEVGRTEFQSTCGKCHCNALLGRNGEAGETPAVDSLPTGMREVVENAGGQVPALAGADFMARWGGWTTKDLANRIKEAVGGFRPENADDETYLRLTAYVLKSNGARPGSQGLTPATAVEIRSLNK
jgi:hypothetical protein